MRRSTAVGIVIASSACFATLAVLTRFAYAENAPPLPLLVWRFGIAAAIMAAYLGLRSPRALAEGMSDLPRFAALSLTGYGAASVCFFFALRYASASVVTVLLYAYPAIVALADALLNRRRVALPVLGAIALTFAGCVLVAGIFDTEVSVSARGIVLGLGAATGYALFTLLSERLTHRPRLVVMTYTFGLSSIGIALIALATGVSLAPTGWSVTLWLILAGIIVFPSLLALLLFLQGLRELGAPRTALVSTLEPVFTILLAALLLAERLTAGQALGALLVIAGIVLAEWPEVVSAP